MGRNWSETVVSENEVCLGPAHSRSRWTQLKLVRETRLPGDRNLHGGGGSEDGGQRVPPPRGAARRAGPFPAPGPRPPAPPIAPQTPEARGTARGLPVSPFGPGRTAAACPLPGAGNGGVRLPGANSVPAPSPSTPPALLAATREKRKLPQGGPGGGQSWEAERVQRGGGGYRSALRPIVSLPGGSRQSRAREPGSSLARHLLPPPLWKRPPPSPGRLARDPASTPPAPPASPAANSRRCGRGSRRHLGAAKLPLPSRRHVRCSHAPAGRAPAAGLHAEAEPPTPLQDAGSADRAARRDCYRATDGSGPVRCRTPGSGPPSRGTFCIWSPTASQP
ncbi:uncharacterized protein LOC130886116 [Chionomys nivalis]|uniref:uncharacterized protein LOC130886116 n=1 Tax=Chionomys nivalis TaxID=269649 RepID=UPI002597B6C2|nr:uncharacterized protein LOC130886116 [Chionomys nivalis]